MKKLHLLYSLAPRTGLELETKWVTVARFTAGLLGNPRAVTC